VSREQLGVAVLILRTWGPSAWRPDEVQAESRLLSCKRMMPCLRHSFGLRVGYYKYATPAGGSEA
jgi:hypothetical protein